MYVTKSSVTIDTTSNNSSTGGYFYSTDSPRGYVDAIAYTRGDVPSTGVLTIYGASTARCYLAKTVTTDSWMVFPRSVVESTVGVVLSSTDSQGTMFPIYNESITVSLAGGTSAATTGLIEVYVRSAGY